MTPYPSISFHVAGDPVTKGSAMAFVQPCAPFPILAHNVANLRAKCRAIITQKHKDGGKWEKAIRAACLATRPGEPRMGGFNVALTFYLRRPASHFGTGRNARKVKPSAPGIPISHRAGDIDKLTRSVLDGLTGALWVDDRQVQVCHSVKVYATGGITGVTICAFYLGDGNRAMRSED